MTERKHVPASDWHIASCAGCAAILRSPFPPHPAHHDPDGFDTFARELALELGAGQDEFSTTEVARAWARAFGWCEEPDGWFCPAHEEISP
jgi:hypothetical protein